MCSFFLHSPHLFHASYKQALCLNKTLTNSIPPTLNSDISTEIKIHPSLYFNEGWQYTLIKKSHSSNKCFLTAAFVSKPVLVKARAELTFVPFLKSLKLPHSNKGFFYLNKKSKKLMPSGGEKKSFENRAFIRQYIKIVMSGLTPLREHKSPHFDPTPIPVEFLILHYTAQSLQGTLNIFLSDTLPVSCHLIIDRDGQIFEMVSCWKGVCHRAFHAGKSRWTDPEDPAQNWKSFNNFSIGVELVNWNGNFYPYTEAQYQSLFQVIHHLKRIYPKLKNPHRILGHEQIAGFRGKVDPGIQFDWQRLFREVYDGTHPPERIPQLFEKQINRLVSLLNDNLNDEKAKKLNLILESSLPFWLKKWRLKYNF